eukprot:378457_1
MSTPQIIIGWNKMLLLLLFRTNSALSITAGALHTCALSSTNKVTILGYGDTNARGDESSEMGHNLTEIDLGTNFIPIQIIAGYTHTCALSMSNKAKCWGYNNDGALGKDDKIQYGNIRKHGAICWGIMHIVVGILLDFVIHVRWLPVLSAITTIPYSIIVYIACKRTRTDAYHQSESQSETEQSVNIVTAATATSTSESGIQAIEMMESNALDDDIEEQSTAQKHHESSTVSWKEFLQYIFRTPSTLSLYFLMFSVGGSQSVATNLLFVYVMYVV